MPNYVSPTWVDNSAPKLNAANLQALTDCVANNQLLHGSGEPTTSTAGAIGQRYRDDTTGIVYVCKSESSGTYTWEPENDHDGFTDEIKQALLQLAAKVVYVDADGQDYYDDLYDALYNTTWAITNTLTGCTTSNGISSIHKGDAYSATITASFGYTLTGATVSITMGGTDITSTAYNNGTISIASVTGTLVISIAAAAKTLSSISAVYTQSGTVYDTDSLDSLKSDLVVTATYSDSSTATVPSADYTLSGTLTEGTSTITVSYRGKTTTFDVTVTHWIINVDVSKFVVGITNTGQSPSYYSQNNTRMSYPAFDLLLDGGKTYKFTVTSSINTAQLGVQAFNQIALDAVNAGNKFNPSGSTGEVWDSGWQGLEDIVQIPLTQHSSPIVGVRFAFRQSTSNPTISSNFVTAMTIEEVTE